MNETSLHPMYLVHTDMWMVSPVGFETHTTAVLAKSKQEAINKVAVALRSYGIDVEQTGTKVLNLTEFFAQGGYGIIISQNTLPKGTYH